MSKLEYVEFLYDDHDHGQTIVCHYTHKTIYHPYCAWKAGIYAVYHQAHNGYAMYLYRQYTLDNRTAIVYSFMEQK